MKHLHSKFLAVFMILFLLLAGCSSAEPQPVQEGSPTQPAVESATTIPEPPAEKAVLVGSLVQKGIDGAPDKPYENLRLFLGILLVADDGKSTLARVDALKAPQAITDAEGNFVFSDLVPDRYVLVLQVPPNNLIKLNNPETGLDMIIDVEGGKITDIGPQYHDLPWFTVPTP